MGKIESYIVDEKETDLVTKSKHLAELATVLGTLWLKRSATQSTFFGHALTDLPPNTHYLVNYLLPGGFWIWLTHLQQQSQTKR